MRNTFSRVRDKWYNFPNAAVIGSIKEETLPEFKHPSEPVIYYFARDLLGEPGVVELVYTLISMSLNVFQV
jgi:hypothetical protein